MIFQTTIILSLIAFSVRAPKPGYFSWKFSHGNVSVICNSATKSCLTKSTPSAGQPSSTVTPIAPETTTVSSSTIQWSYENPSLWPLSFPSCGGNSQSPINISPPIVPRPSTSIVFNSDYLVPIDTVQVTNTGKSVETVLVQPSNVDPIIRYENFEYRFVSFHFHWGPNNSVGSETTFQGQRFPLELNMIHIRTIYATTEEAFGQPDGTLILGVSFALAPTDNPTLSRLISVFSSLRNVESIATINDFPPLITLISDTNELSHVFDYVGSLTTPPCTENIRWLILSEQLSVSASQMDAFRNSFLTDDGSILRLNYRPTQERNGRSIFGEKFSISEAF